MSRLLASAYGVKYMNITRTDRCRQAFLALDVLAADKHVDMPAYFALFVQDTIAERQMLLPQGIESIAYGGELPRQVDLDLAVGERLEMARQMNNNRHPG